MNKKAEMKGGLAIFVILFIGIIFGIAIWNDGIAPTIYSSTNIKTATNVTYTTAATVNDSIDLVGRENTTAIVVVNASDGTVWTSNFTLLTTDSSGNLGLRLKTTDAAGAVGLNGSSANISYSYKDVGYVDQSGGRSIFNVTNIFIALAIAGIALLGVKGLWDKYS